MAKSPAPVEAARPRNILITCGPAYEPIDAVRRITNHSTGTLGLFLADRFAQAGWRVAVCLGEGATCPERPAGVTYERFATNSDLFDMLQRLSHDRVFDCVLHCAALCDFRVARTARSDGENAATGKIRSSDGALVLHLEPLPKLISHLRNWFPKAWIAGWKYEVDGTRADALARGQKQIADAHTDGCVVNGPAFGPGFALQARGEPGGLVECDDAGELANALERALEH